MGSVSEEPKEEPKEESKEKEDGEAMEEDNEEI